MDIQVNFFNWFAALIPILFILVLMVKFKWSAAKAGSIGWFSALLISAVVFKADFHLLAFSNAKGMVMAFYVLYIIWGALFVYNVVDEVGGIKVIGSNFSSMTNNKVLLIMMIGVAFVTFLQGVAGFGVPVAVGAPLLASMGFDPVVSVAIPLIGHAWSVTFGDMASSFVAVQNVTGLSPTDLAPWTAFFTGLSGIFVSFFAVHCYGGFSAIKSNWVLVLIISLSMSATQFLTACWEPTLATFIAGIVGMLVVAALTRLPVSRTYRDAENETAAALIDSANKASKSGMSFNLAFSTYYALIAIVGAVEFIEPLEKFLNNQFTFKLKFGEYATGYGWKTAAGWSKTVSVFGHPGALLIYAGLIGIIIYKSRGLLQKGSLKKVCGRVVKSGLGSSIATTSMILMAFMMIESGMIFILAKGVVNAFGSVYPLFTPLVGVLGAFITGSNTNSNVMFGAFQKQVAELLGVSTLINVAAQSAGGSIGSMIAPAKVIVGTSTMGLDGKEGQVIKMTLKYCLLLALLLGLLNWLMLYLVCRNVY